MQKLTICKDCNLGLVRQVIQAYRQFSVLELRNTYDALTIGHIARKTSPDPNDYAETGHYVSYLIATDKLNAVIEKPSANPASWLLVFCGPISGPLARSEEQDHDALALQKIMIIGLQEHIRETDRKLSLHKDYIADAKKRKKEKADVGDEGNSWNDQGNPFDHDEDVMGGP